VASRSYSGGGAKLAISRNRYMLFHSVCNPH
jgi:hypothetical protein